MELATTMTLGEALAGINPKKGDQVKSQTAFAYFGTHGWEGNLDALESGKGYLYQSVDAQTKTFTYPTLAAGHMQSEQAHRLMALHQSQRRPMVFTPVSPTLYPDNMTMVILLTDDGTPVTDAEIAAYIDGECRGVAVVDTDGEQPLYYLLISGEGSGQAIELRIALGDQVLTLNPALSYSSDGNIGTPWSPYVVDINDAVSINVSYYDLPLDGNWYTIQGICLGTDKPAVPGIYLRNGKKHLIK